MKNNDNLTNQDLSTVGEFKAIVARRTKRKEFGEQEHKNLVRDKFADGKSKNNHITLFRVQDKESLGKKEIKDHTVQGPYWTPPSSVGYVLGGMSNDLRIWLATEPKDDNTGIMQGDNKPAIYFREIISPILAGYTPRIPKTGEEYGRTGRSPKFVLTPPLGRKSIGSEEIQKIMNVDNDFNDLPLDKSYITNIPKLSTLSLKNKNIGIDDFDSDFLADIDFNDLEPELLDIMLNKPVLLLIKEEGISLDEIMELYAEFIEGSAQSIDSAVFIDMYYLLSKYGDEFRKLFAELNMDVVEIINLYEDEYELFCALSEDILKVYDNEVDWIQLRDIYRANKELFDRIVKDPEGAIPGIGLQEFIEQFEVAQEEIAQILNDDPNYGAYDPYHWVINKITYENCPDEFLAQDSDSEDNSSQEYSEIEEEGILIFPKEDNPAEYFSAWILRFDINKVNKSLQGLGIGELLPTGICDKGSSHIVDNILQQLQEIIKFQEIFEFSANNPTQVHYSFFIDEEQLQDINSQKQEALEVLHEARNVEHQLIGLVDYINFDTSGDLAY